MYLDSGVKSECFGCESCAQICPKGAISLKEDTEGFRYPIIDKEKCIGCDMCRNACPHFNPPTKNEENKYVYGGYINDPEVRFNSTSGGAFSAIVDSFCDSNYVIFGAESQGLQVFHRYITEKGEIGSFRKSKYSQSNICFSYKEAKEFLDEGKKVLFSGTPCQIAALISYLSVSKTSMEKLLTIEVICEGVPSPLYIEKYNRMLIKKYGEPIQSIDYRYTGKSILSNGKWDFQVMRVELKNSKRVIIKDRWFNPFWSVWLQHLMSRPSCYKCPFASQGRVADISLGDLWGVHIYCPELYGKNGGSSLIVCNTEKGKEVFKIAQKQMFGHCLSFNEALKYQSPMRRTISDNSRREECMMDLREGMSFEEFNKKWAKSVTLKLLIQKYIWGNRQKITIWNLMCRLKKGTNDA